MAITNATLAQKINDLIEQWETFQVEQQAWMNGVVGGGPNLDGQYPLTDYLGTTVLATCPAQLEDDVDNVVTGGAAQEANAAASAAAALVSEANSATSETNAGASETAALSYRDAALAAQVAAETARNTAIAQAAAAVVSAAAALASETAAALSETNAATSETNAATSETNAGLSEGYAAEWANKAEDSLVSAAAGGDEVDDYSALHWANKAAATAAGIGSFDSLSDVVITTPANRHAAMYDGANFVNRLLVEADISDLGSYSLDSHNHSGVYEPVDADIARVDVGETVDAKWDFGYGIQGGYVSEGTTWAATIWTIGDSWTGGIAGAGSVQSNNYGLRWIRSTNADVDSRVSEGLYVYKAGVQYAGFGDGGSFINGTLEVSDIIKGTRVSSGLSNGVVLESATPGLYWHETGEAASEKGWKMYAAGGDLNFYTTNDSGSATDLIFKVTRVGTTISEFQFGNNDIHDVGSITFNATNDDVKLDAVGLGNLQLTTEHATLDFGSLNSSYCHFNTTASSGFYFYDNMQINSGQQVFSHSTTSYVSGDVTFSTSAPSGGANGDIWFEYT